MGMLPMLYKRTSTKKIQTWEIEVSGTEGQRCGFRTISGQLDGKQVTSEWTWCEPKNVGRSNETTSYQQTMLEAKSAWQKKKDTGYTEIIDDVDTAVTYVKPMLAKEYGEHKHKLVYPVFAQPKLDGMRAITAVSTMTSRNGKPIISAPHIPLALARVWREYPDLVFDGELYADKFKEDFNKIISLAKKTKPTVDDLNESVEHLQYWIYDLVIPGMSFDERYNMLLTVFNQFRLMEHPSLVLVQTVRVANEGFLNICYEQWLEQGMEGQMVRVRDAEYQNKRTADLLKRKEFKEDEFHILDVEEGIGNKSGMAGNVVLVLPDGRTFSANVMGGVEFSRELLIRKAEAIGKLATIKFFNYTPDGIPRFPHMKSIRDYE